MKRLLFVLLVIGIASTAGADVLVYNVKQAQVEMQNNSNVWSQLKASYSDYFVIEPQTNGTANVQAVLTYKAKDLNGKLQNYYTIQDMGTLTLLQVQAGTKQKWILTGSVSQLQIVLIGDGKPARKAPGDHGNGPHCSNCHSGRADRVPLPASAPTMTGSSVWNQADGSDMAIGNAKITLKLSSSLTELAAKNSYSATDAVNYIVGNLTAKKYILGN
jgi:hypothetical protein